MSAGDVARVSVSVAVPPAIAFEVFTQDIDRWWRRGLKFRQHDAASSRLHIEPRLDGRLFESAGERQALIEVGRIHVWDPPQLLAFSWRNVNYRGAEMTQVEVAFRAITTGTLVTVTHRALASLRADHPARHGLAPAEFVRMTALWWGEQLTSLRRVCATARA